MGRVHFQESTRQMFSRHPIPSHPISTHARERAHARWHTCSGPPLRKRKAPPARVVAEGELLPPSLAGAKCISSIHRQKAPNMSFGQNMSFVQQKTRDHPSDFPRETLCFSSNSLVCLPSLEGCLSLRLNVLSCAARCRCCVAAVSLLCWGGAQVLGACFWTVPVTGLMSFVSAQSMHNHVSTPILVHLSRAVHARSRAADTSTPVHARSRAPDTSNSTPELRGPLAFCRLF